MASYDILGNLALVKFPRKTSKTKKLEIAKKLLKQPSVTTVLEKTAKFKGRLRTLKTKFISGINTKEALYRENNCIFRFNVETCYFSPRLANERLELANQVKNQESVLVLFGGVAPFAIEIAKTKKQKKVISIELGKECNKYAQDNIKRNKVQVELIQGDVKRVLPKLKEKFSRIIMARPNLKDLFLKETFPKAKKGTIIHFYGFCHENDLNKLVQQVQAESKKAKRKIKILKIKKAGDIAPYKYRYRIDFKVLN